MYKPKTTTEAIWEGRKLQLMGQREIEPLSCLIRLLYERQQSLLRNKEEGQHEGVIQRQNR